MLVAAVGLDHADSHVDALAPALLRRLQHGVGLAHPGGGAEEDLQPAARLPLRRGEKRFGRGSSFAV
jgi:hypothetical protein